VGLIMDYTEKLTDLIKGKLNDLDQQSLFSSLASDGTLRTEYNCIANVSESISSNISSFAPSSDLKASIYSKAGISLGAASSSGTAALIPINTGLFKGGLLSYLLTAILTAGITIVAMMTLLNQESNDLAFDQISKNEAPFYEIIFSSKDENNSALPEISNTSQPVSSYQEPYEYLDAKEIETQQEAAKHINLSSPIRTNINRPLVLNKMPTYQSSGMPELINRNQRDKRLSIEYKSTASWHIPAAGISPEQYSEFNNSDISVNYMIDKDLSVGLSIRQETFYTEYESFESDGIYLFKQQPNFTTFSIVSEYKLVDYDDLSVLGGVAMGLNKGGYVIRPSIGLEYQAYHNLAFQAGLEYSHFWFGHQNRINSARKYGFYYGLSFQL
jgi:hypothetical protein